MTLTIGRSPFGSGNRGTYETGSIPEHIRYWEPWPRRVRAMLGGETVLDSGRGAILFETDAFPLHYFPLDDLRAEVLTPSSTAAPDGMRRWDIRAGGRSVEGAVTASPRDGNGQEILAGMVTIDFGAMDRWFEEDEPIYAHFRDPYHRVDVRPATRHVVVRHGDTIVAETDRPKLLFETSVPVRYYLPFADIRIDLLEKSDTVSECPYKGDGQHWHLRVGDDRIEDAAWSLPHPLPEGIPAAEHVCFYVEKVHVEVDGELVVE